MAKLRVPVLIAEIGCNHMGKMEIAKRFIDVAQGFCISRPLAPNHFMSWLATTNHPSRVFGPLDFSRWVDAGDSRDQAPQLD